MRPIRSQNMYWIQKEGCVNQLDILENIDSTDILYSKALSPCNIIKSVYTLYNNHICIIQIKLSTYRHVLTRHIFFMIMLCALLLCEY